MREEREDVYIIPHNYTDNGKVLGIIEKQSFITAAVWFGPLTYLDFAVLPASMDVKLYILILLICPPTAFALVGIGSEPLHRFVKYIYDFYKKAKYYPYEK